MTPENWLSRIFWEDISSHSIRCTNLTPIESGTGVPTPSWVFTSHFLREWPSSVRTTTAHENGWRPRYRPLGRIAGWKVVWLRRCEPARECDLGTRRYRRLSPPRQASTQTRVSA